MNKKNAYKFWQKIISIFLTIILFFTGTLIPKNSYSNNVYAAKEKTPFDLIILLVESELFKPGIEKDENTLTGKIYRYAEDIRMNMNQTKVKILTVDKQDNPIDISDTLERFYFDGDKDEFEESYLKGIVLIGDIPIPEVNVSDKESIISIAPYVDFHEKAFIYSPLQKKYIKHIHEFKPEIWHGIIPRFEYLEDIEKYFDENHKYYTGENKMKREMFYADLIAEEASTNNSQYQFYQNTVAHAEDIANKRYSSKFLTFLTGGLIEHILPADQTEEEKELENIIKQNTSSKRGPCPFGEPPPPSAIYSKKDMEQMKNNSSIPDTFSVYQIDKFLPEYGKVVESHIKDIYGNVAPAERWKNENIDYLAREITLKDVESRERLKNFNDIMKNVLVQFVEKEWQVPIEIPISKKYYGKSGGDLQNIKECTWYRGSIRGDLSQLIEYNRTYDIKALNCKGYEKCCSQYYSTPQYCNPFKAQNPVTSIAGARISAHKYEPSYKDCFLEYNEKGIQIPISINKNLSGKKLSSLYVHDEPNNQTILSQIKSRYTPNLPIDSIPYIDFQDKYGGKTEILLPNVFKTKKNVNEFLKEETFRIQDIQSVGLQYTEKEISKIKACIEVKNKTNTSFICDNEYQNFSISDLQTKLQEYSMNTIPNTFFTNVFSEETKQKIDKLIKWNNASITEKYQIVAREKMFSASNNDQKKEFLYLRSNFVNTDLFFQRNPTLKEERDQMQEIWIQQQSKQEKKSLDNSEKPQQELNEECGSYEEGVEIWEWPAAVMCWVKSLKNFKFFDFEEFKNEWKKSWKDYEKELDQNRKSWEKFLVTDENESQNNNSNNKENKTFINEIKELEYKTDNEDNLKANILTLYAPEKVSIQSSTLKGIHNKSILSVFLADKNKKLSEEFKEVDVRLPSGVETDTIDINENKKGLQIPLISGESDLTIWSYENIIDDAVFKLDDQEQTTRIETVNNLNLKVEFKEDSITDMYSMYTIFFTLDKPYYGTIEAYLPNNDPRIVFSNQKVQIIDGKGMVMAARKTSNDPITFKVTSKYFPEKTVSFPKQESKPFKFYTEKDTYYIALGDNFELDVKILDQFLNDYKKDVEFKLFITPKSNKYTSFKSQMVIAENGETKIIIPTNGMEGIINLSLQGEGLETKLISIKTGIKLTPDDVKGTSSVFTFLVEEGEGDSGEFLKKMLENGTMAVAQRKYPILKEKSFILYKNGVFDKLNDDIIIENRNKFEFTVTNKSTLEEYMTFDIGFLKNPTVSKENENAEIFIDFIDDNTFDLTEQNDILLNEVIIAKIYNNGIDLMDNRLSKNIFSENEKIVMELVFDDLPVCRIYISPNQKTILNKSKLLYHNPRDDSYILYSSNDENRKSHTDGTGFVDDDYSILGAAARSPFGEAFMLNQNESDMFWGDPVLNYNINSSDIYDSGYDHTIGKKIFETDDKINEIRSIDYNYDGKRDVLLKEGEKTLVLLENGMDGNFVKRWDYGFKADKIHSLDIGDFKQDGYEDIVIGSDSGKIYYFSNRKGHIKPEIILVESDSREIRQLDINDFDNDGFKDILLSNSRGEIVVYYGKKGGFEKEKQIVKSFGVDLINEDAGKDVAITDFNMDPIMKVYYNGKAYEIADFGDFNEDTYKDISLISLIDKKAEEKKDIKSAYAYEVIPTNTKDSIEDELTFYGSGSGYFNNEGVHVYNKNNKMLHVSEIQKHESVFLSIKEDNSTNNEDEYAPTSKEVAVKRFENIHKYYTSLDRNSVDINSIVEVNLSIPAAALTEGDFIVDKIPFMFSYVYDSAKCNMEPCQTQGLEGSFNIAIGPIYDISKDLDITYQLRVQDTPNIKYVLDKSKNEVSVYNERKAYAANNDRSWKEISLTFAETKKTIEVGDPSLPQSNFKLDEQTKKEWSVSNEDLTKTFEESLIDKLNKAVDFLTNLNCIKGGCLAIPINMAFFVPGTHGLSAPTPTGDGGFVKTIQKVLDKIPIKIPKNTTGKPIFGINSSIYGWPCSPPPGNCCVNSKPMPVPASGEKTYQPNVIPLAGACYQSPNPGKGDSDFRVYLSPTLTGGLGMAVCKSQNAGYMPKLIQDVIKEVLPPNPTKKVANETVPKCFAFALPLPFKNACDKLNESVSNTLSNATKFSQSVSDSGKKIMSFDGGHIENDSTKTQGVGIAIGTQSRNYEQAKKSESKDKSTYPFYKQLFLRWWDAQKKEFAKLLILPSVTLYYPDMKSVIFGGEDSLGQKSNGMISKFDEAKKNFQEEWNKKSDGTSSSSDKNSEEYKKSELSSPTKSSESTTNQPNSQPTTPSVSSVSSDSTSSSGSFNNTLNTLNKALKEGSLTKTITDPIKSGMEKVTKNAQESSDFINKNVDEAKNFGKGVKDKFDSIFDLLENVPFFVLERKTINVKVPWLNPQELVDIIAELETWIKENIAEIERFEKMLNEIISKCGEENEKLYDDVFNTGKTIQKIGTDVYNLDMPKEDKIEFTSKACEVLSANIKVLTNLKKFIHDAENILNTLKSYRDFPKKLAKYKSMFSYYLVDALNYANRLIDVLGGWIIRNKKIAEKYLELIYTIKQLLKVWELIDLGFEAYSKSCNTCKAESYSQNFDLYGALMGLIPTPPVIKFPPWPDVILDMSHVTAGIKIILPEFRFHVREISFEMNLDPIKLPDDLKTALNLNLDIKIPDLPELPELPELPDLPEFPNLPLPHLPDLPPPPKLPDFLLCIGQWVQIIKIIMKLYCLVTTGIWQYPENNLTRIIEALTNRSSGTLLSLDFLQLQIPDISFPWIESFNVDGYLNIEPKFDVTSVVKKNTDKLNEYSEKAASSIERSINDSLNSVSSQINQKIIESNNKINKEEKRIKIKVKENINQIQNNIDKKFDGKDTRSELPQCGAKKEITADEFIDQFYDLYPSVKRPSKFSIKTPSIKNLEKFSLLLKNTLDKTEKDISILENTSNILALHDAQEEKEYSLSAVPLYTSPVKEITLKGEPTEEKIMDLVNKQITEVQKYIQNSQKIIDGMIIFDENKNFQEKIVSYSDITKNITSMIFFDYDLDTDEDIFYSVGNKLYLKESYEVQRDLSSDIFSYENVSQIGSLSQYIPLKRSVNDLQAFSNDGYVDFSWYPDNDTDTIGYILERKSFVFGFDQHKTTKTDYVFLLNNQLYENDKEIKGKSDITIGNTKYSILNEETALVKQYINPEYRWYMPYDFYYLKIYSLNSRGEKSTSSRQVLLSPQKAFDTTPPILLENNKNRVPVLKEWPIEASETYDKNLVKYNWDLDQDGIPEMTGPFINFPAQEDLGIKTIAMNAEDTAGNKINFNKKVEIYTPQIIIDEATSEYIKGHTEPRIPLMPFSLIRKRNDKQKFIRPNKGDRFLTDINGDFMINKSEENTGILIRDSQGKHIANVDSETGYISIIDNTYKLQAIPATQKYPTEMIIIKNDKYVASRISYVSAGQKVDIVKDMSNLLNPNLVSIIDSNIEDNVDILKIPENAYYFGGGAALVGAQKELIAAISKEGLIRFMSEYIKLDYEQKDKNLFFVIKNINGIELARIHIGALYNATTDAKKVSMTLLDFIKHLFVNEVKAEETDDSIIRNYSKDINEEVSEEKEKKSIELPFSDLNTEHTYYKAIKDLYYRNILKGYDDGTFHPDAKITRAEFVKVALGSTSCFDCASPSQATKSLFFERKPFPDINFTDWYYFCISIAKKEEMVTGYGDGRFYPNKNISRKEAVAVLLRQVGAELETTPATYFKDVPEYDWAKDYVFTAVKMGLIKNLNGFVFPNEEITRGEFAMMASRILEIRDCKPFASYDDTHTYVVGELPKKPDELPIKKPISPEETSEEADGTKITKTPDGVITKEKPDGTKITFKPDGEVTTVKPDSTTETIRPDKTKIIRMPDKTVVEELPDGHISVILPNGQVVSKAPEIIKIPGEKDEHFRFSGICNEFKDHLCPYIKQDLPELQKGILVEPAKESIYSPLPLKDSYNIDCIFCDNLEDIKVDDKVYAVIISSDGIRVFSKSNEMKVK